tara:strand:- start:424 stop:876 length:453 start_codon:yes stop_codon:yes gene_type:complete
MSTLSVDTITGKSTSTNLTIGSTPVVSASANSLTIRGENSAQTSIQQGLAKAWFHIDNGGASTIALGDSFNAANSSGVTDGGTGIYNFSFGSNMENADYSLTMGSQAGAGFPDKPQINSQATSSFQCRQAHASDEVDAAIYNALVHGDLA